MGERVIGSGKRAPRIAAVYASDEPAMSRFLYALHQLEPVTGISFERANEFLQIALGIYPRDPMRPARMWVPSRRPRYWPGLHGPWARRLTREAPLVLLTRPDQAALLPFVADRRIAYHAVDDYRHYRCFRFEDEQSVVAASSIIFACSTALAERLRRDFDLPPERVVVLPNAIQSCHLPAACPSRPAGVPGGLGTGRPLIGMIGTVDNRTRYDWLRHCVETLPWAHWLWVGRIEQQALSVEQRDTLAWLRAHPRCTFTGWRDFDDLPGFAAALDAALVPYQGIGTVPCASPMRSFVQMPFGAPILATPDCPAMREMAPDVRICTTPDALAGALAELRACDFDDGRREHRWRRGCAATFEARAAEALQVLRPLLDEGATP